MKRNVPPIITLKNNSGYYSAIQVILTLTIILISSQALAFEFCDEGTVGENNIRLISVNDMLKENTKEWTWQPYQKVEIEVRVENKNDESEDYTLEAVFKDGDRTIRIAKESNDLETGFTLSANERKSISLNFEVDEDIDSDDYDLYIKFYKEDNEDEECVENSEEEITIEIIEICDDEKVDEDELEITKIRDETEDNDNAWEWTPGDNIEISLNLENKDYSEREFAIELIFLDENNEEVFLADDSDDVYEETNLKENEDDEINFNFKLKSNIEEEKYTLYAKAYDTDNENICTSLKAEDKSDPITILVERDERKVIITNVEGPTQATTSSNTQYTVKLTNLGSEDESKVLAIAYNYQLGIMQKLEISSLNSGEEETVTFDISFPYNASLSRHAILFSTEYEYNENQDYYRSASDSDDDIKHYVTLTQGAIPEEAIEEVQNKTTEQNETIIEEPLENETEIPTTIITGNVIGTPNESPSWIILLGLLILAIIGIVLFFKKPKVKKATKIEAPNVIRRYTAKL